MSWFPLPTLAACAVAVGAFMALVLNLASEDYPHAIWSAVWLLVSLGGACAFACAAVSAPRNASERALEDEAQMRALRERK